MFCNIISYKKHRCPESDSEILGDFIFLTIAYTEETDHTNNKSLYTLFNVYTCICGMTYLASNWL